MSKNDRLGPIVRAMVGIDVEHHGVLADIINRFNSKDALAWSGRFAETLMAGLPKVEPVVLPPLLSVIATTQLGAISGKKTVKCFTDDTWGYRDRDFDNWLPADQSKTGSCVISTCAHSRGWTFAEDAAYVLGVSADTPTRTLGELLIARGHTITLPQVELMAADAERGVSNGLRTDGYGNFFFVETGDPENPVSVGNLRRDERGWSAGVRQLGYAYHWSAGRHLLLRNLDASKL